MSKPNKFKRLFFDIEVSPNVVYSWNIGETRLSHDNIIKERAIICICYKFEGDSKIHSLTWNKGDDKKLLEDFSKIINSADEVIGHNGDNFDIKWIKARAIYHRISIIPDIQSIDTLKIARKGFRFNSNKLDYLGQYLGLGKKIDHGGFALWKEVLNNSKPALDKMVKYCKQDVNLLEKVFQALNKYTLPKAHIALYNGGSILDCPNCSSKRTISNGLRITATGLSKRRLQCLDCGKYFSIPETTYKSLTKITK